MEIKLNVVPRRYDYMGSDNDSVPSGNRPMPVQQCSQSCIMPYGVIRDKCFIEVSYTIGPEYRRE